MQQATQRVLTVRHTCDKSRQPLAVIDGFPGRGAELNPTQLRRLARLLNTIPTMPVRAPAARSRTR